LTPDGRPIIGPTAFRNLSLNTGHGPLGWTLAAGSGLALAELIATGTPSIDLAPFAFGR
jgi:D-amino-acid dehydrogenase